MNLKQCDNFNYSADQYAVQYLYEKETTIQNQLKQAQDAFYCKKRDESGNVTHVCKIREELRRFCIKLKLGKRHVKYDDEK